MKIILSLIGRIVGSTGGVEKVACNMANALADRGHDVTILAFENKEGIPFFPLKDDVKFLNLGIGFKFNHTLFNLKHIFMNRAVKEKERLLFDCNQIAERVQEDIKLISPDIVVTFEKRSDVLFKKYIKGITPPIITMFHFDYKSILKNKSMHDIYEQSDCIQVLTKNDLINTKKIIKKPLVVLINNAVPQFSESSQLEHKCIINVARVEPNQKRQHLLIEAFSKIKDKYPDWKVKIYGEVNFDKKYYEKCCRLISNYGLEKQIEFCGKTNDIKAKLLDSSIFAFPSSFEGFPLALTEAMAIGLPVIGYTSCSGTNEVIKDGETGFLCEDGVEPFAEALDKLMGDKDLRIKMGKSAKESMKEYAPEKIWNQWEELIEKVIREQ